MKIKNEQKKAAFGSFHAEILQLLTFCIKGSRAAMDSLSW